MRVFWREKPPGSRALLRGGFPARRMRFGPNQLPGTVLAGELPNVLVGAMVRVQACREVVRMAEVELAFGISKDIDVEHNDPRGRIGSRGRARTCNPPVNSRLLYH